MASPRIMTLPYNPERYLPYRLLWVRVIVRAAYDYALWRESSKMNLRKHARDAGKWLFEPSTLINGFETICELFDLPREDIRAWARKLTREDVKKLEFRERDGRAPMDALLASSKSEEAVAEDGDA